MKRLTLKSETLAELAADDLAAVVGGAPPTLNVRECTPTSLWQHTVIDCLTRDGCE
jgi:hypothetical protein